MPFPSNVNTIIVTGTYLTPAGLPASGYVSFATTIPVVDFNGNTIISGGPVSAELNDLGSFSIQLACTDNTTLSPLNFLYWIHEEVSGMQTAFPASLPNTIGGVVNINQLSPYSVAGGVTQLNNTWTGTNSFTAETTVPVPVNAGDAASKSYVDSHTTDWVNPVSQYDADPTGVSDSTSAINTALAAAPLGGTVYLPAGTYKISAPLVIPPQVTLRGPGSWHIDTSTCEIIPSSSFSGAAILLMYDQVTGNYSVASNSQAILNLILNGSNITGSIDGIQSQGFVHGVIIQDVQIYKAPAHGIACVTNSSGVAYSWRGTRVAADTCGTHGFSLAITDCTWYDLEAIGNGQNGFNLSGSAANSHFTNCRSEYNGFNGYSLSQAWGTGTGSGGVLFTGCSTDGNVQNGVSLTATGSVPVTFNGLMCRRDGANGTSGGGSFAGVKASGHTLPTHINGLSVFPGIALTGGVNTPEYGVAFASTSSNISVNGGVIYAATTPWYDDGSNSAITRGPNIIERIGTTSSYTTAYNGLQSSDTTLTFNEPGSVASTNLLSSYLCAPVVVAPGSQTTYTVTTDSLAAWSTGVLCTNSFAAPPSGKVIVEVTCGLSTTTSGYDIMFALAATGSTTPLFGNTQTVQQYSASVLQQHTLKFYVAGLTSGTSYQFDLLGACSVSGGGTNETATMYTYGGTSASIASKGLPFVMTVQAV